MNYYAKEALYEDLKQAGVFVIPILAILICLIFGWL